MKFSTLSESFPSTSWDHEKPRSFYRENSFSNRTNVGGLSVFFTILCIVDLFGVFPVIALPKSIIACGLYGVPLVLFVFALQMYTAVLLGRSWLVAQEISPRIGEKNRFPYAAVAELAFGPKARKLVIFLIDATVFGAGIPNLIVASQSLQLFWWKISGGEVGVSYCFWMLLIGFLLCPVMWLGSPKDMKPLALTSVCIVTTVAVATWACIVNDDESPLPTEDVLEYVPTARDFLIAYGIIAFQFDIHPMLLTIQVDMKNSSKIHAAVLGGFAITGFMFAVTSMLAATRYGHNIEANILQGIPASVPLYLVALLVTMQLCLSSAVGNSALFQHIEDILHVPREFCLQRCLVRSAIVAAAVFLGESVPRFDVVMGLIGSTLTGPLMFIFPPLFFLKLCHMKQYLQQTDPCYPTKTKLRLITTPENSIQDGGYREGSFKDGDDELPLNRDTFKTQYQTFESSGDSTPPLHQPYEVQNHDILCASVVMVLGIAATMVATYSSWTDAVNSASFSVPCLVNSTAAARDFIMIVKNNSLVD